MENKKIRVGLIVRDYITNEKAWICRDYSNNITLEDNSFNDDYKRFLSNLGKSFKDKDEIGAYLICKEQNVYKCSYSCTFMEFVFVFGYGNTPENALADCQYNIKTFLNIT